MSAPEQAGALRLYLFGPMRVEIEGQVIALPRRDSQRLVGYLALHRRGRHRREVLAETLWPDAGDRSRRSLSDAVYRLRRQLGDGWLEADADTLALGDGVSVDVWEFDRLAASRELADLDLAVAMQSGDLVPGVYDDWALEHRAARHTAAISALTRLAEGREVGIEPTTYAR